MPRGYFPRAFEIVRAAGGVAIVDEVQTGFTRTGAHYWGFEGHDVSPDIVVLGKGMGNGLPIAGVVARREVAEAFARRPFFNTFALNPIACEAARSVLQVIDDEALQANVQARHAQLAAGLKRLHAEHELVGDVRGEGLMMAVELVEDRGTKVPAPRAAIAVGQALRERGVICVRGGLNRNVFRINPPMSITAADIDHLLGALGEALAVARG